MDITFHGAAQEVGKSCIVVAHGARRYILDAGVKFINGGVLYPEPLERMRDIGALFLSHAHMDHAGALPVFERAHLPAPIYATAMTWRIANLLLEDAYHIAQLRGLHPAYAARDIRAVAADVRIVDYDRDLRTPDGAVRFRYLNAGHIPGSASIFLDFGDRRIFYTGDINTQPTLLMKHATPAADLRALGVTPDNPLDALIIETTYGNREHPDRMATRAAFVQSVQDAIARGGTVLVPCFGVGRAQEVLLMLAQLPRHIQIYLDGMARTISTMVATEEDPYVRARGDVKAALRRVHSVRRHEREDVARQRGAVIISTSGMLQGGPSVYYTEQLFGSERNTIILTGYQVEGTRGRSLWEDRLFYRHGEAQPVRCRVEKFDFSAHYGMRAIHDLIRSVPHKHLILQHGDHGALDAVATFARAQTDSVVHVPHCGETITL